MDLNGFISSTRDYYGQRTEPRSFTLTDSYQLLGNPSQLIDRIGLVLPMPLGWRVRGCLDSGLWLDVSGDDREDALWQLCCRLGGFGVEEIRC